MRESPAGSEALSRQPERAVDCQIFARARMSCSVWRQPITIAWLYPPSKKGGWLSTKDFSFGAAIFDYVPPPEEELRTLLERWIDQFSSDDFAEYISSKGVKAWAVGYEAAAARGIFTLESVDPDVDVDLYVRFDEDNALGIHG